MRQDEAMLLRAIQARGRNVWSPDWVSVREIIDRLGIHWKRANYILEKWGRKGWYEYGVCIDLGWLTKEGMSAVLPEVG